MNTAEAHAPLAWLPTTLANPGIHLETGPFRIHIQSPLRDVAQAIAQLYAHHPITPAEGFADFHLQLVGSRGLRRFWHTQAHFLDDGREPYHPLPRAQAFAFLEWGMNACIANTAHQYLIVHAAAIEKNGAVALLPAPPGAGKSTLCAALVHRGWRLLSDELALIDAAGQVHPLARPINLKNDAIDIIRKFSDAAQFGPIVRDTRKGQVAHLAPPPSSVAAMHTPATVRWIVFPRWQAAAACTWQARGRHQAFIELAEHAFNYSILGEPGFERLGSVVSQSQCWDFCYSQLDAAVQDFEQLARNA